MTPAYLVMLLLAAGPEGATGAKTAEASVTEADESADLVKIRRIYVEKLNGSDSAQIRDMIITALQASKLFVMTENPDRADAILRGSAEDLIFTDLFQSSDSIDGRAGIGSTGSGSNRRGGINMSVGQHENTRIAERKHEASASVRLVNKDGDVIWSTTQESLGAKFRGASADVADKVAKQLISDCERLRKTMAKP
jgi:hypothetical protein